MTELTWKSDLPAIADRLPQAIDAGLVAAAELLAGAISEALLPGYTSGTFVTGAVANSVTISEPEPFGDGRVIYVGTNVKYALFWEMGHMNLFTRKYERVEIWRPLSVEMLPQLQQAFADAFRGVMHGAGGAHGPLQATPTLATSAPSGA